MATLETLVRCLIDNLAWNDEIASLRELGESLEKLSQEAHASANQSPSEVTLPTPVKCDFKLIGKDNPLGGLLVRAEKIKESKTSWRRFAFRAMGHLLPY